VINISQTVKKNKCVHWGENRLDEYFLDVGCVIGYCDCKIKNCEDYQE